MRHLSSLKVSQDERENLQKKDCIHAKDKCFNQKVTLCMKEREKESRKVRKKEKNASKNCF